MMEFSAPVPISMQDAARTAEGAVQPSNLRSACQQFEGLLMGMILKDSLAESDEGSDDGVSAGMGDFRDFCIEQVATTLAEQAPLGIADQMMMQQAVEARKEVEP